MPSDALRQAKEAKGKRQRRKWLLRMQGRLS
jgi:hypothetical protein